jgi:hypothetical protein
LTASYREGIIFTCRINNKVGFEKESIMHDYEGLGNSVTLIIGVIIGIIILFFICRELMCWYFKINKLVVLLEEQNSLLRDSAKRITPTMANTQGGNSNESKDAITSFDKNNNISTVSENVCRVKKETPLNDALSARQKLIRILRIDEKVTIEHTMVRDDLGGKWALIKTENNDEGWCLFEALEE